MIIWLAIIIPIFCTAVTSSILWIYFHRKHKRQCLDIHILSKSIDLLTSQAAQFSSSFIPLQSAIRSLDGDIRCHVSGLAKLASHIDDLEGKSQLLHREVREQKELLMLMQFDEFEKNLDDCNKKYENLENELKSISTGKGFDYYEKEIEKINNRFKDLYGFIKDQCDINRDLRLSVSSSSPAYATKIGAHINELRSILIGLEKRIDKLDRIHNL